MSFTQIFLVGVATGAYSMGMVIAAILVALDWEYEPDEYWKPVGFVLFWLPVLIYHLVRPQPKYSRPA